MNKKTIKDAKIVAIKNKGKCLSLKYLNSKNKLIWKCEEGHKWTASLNTINRGHWCPFCAGVGRKTIEDMHLIAEKNGWRCLSDKYINAREKIFWECKFGHKWETSYHSIQKGSGCPSCSGKKKKTINNMKDLVKNIGGKCLSKKYKNTKTKILWECSNGHKFYSTPGNVRSGYWCPTCASLKNEKITRMHIEELLGYKFPTVRPEWLISPEGNKMQLDGYNDDLKLAFEYNGIQHYKLVPFFHDNVNLLNKRKFYDYRKRIGCRERGIKLITIPYTIERNKIKDYLINKLNKLGYKLVITQPTMVCVKTKEE